MSMAFDNCRLPVRPLTLTLSPEGERGFDFFNPWIADRAASLGRACRPKLKIALSPARFPGNLNA